MESDQEIQNAAIAIVSFTDLYVQNKQRKQNEQSESLPSLTDIVSTLQYLRDQIQYFNACKQVIRVPKLLQSLIALVTFRLGTHLREQTDLLRLEVRQRSRLCLSCIQDYRDAYVQSELVRQDYGKVICISFCTAGGIGEEHDEEIHNGLFNIFCFLQELYEGRNNDYDYYDVDWQQSFKPLPLLARVSLEQIEEEGANEEIDALMNNKGMNGYIKGQAKDVKAETLNHFINWD
ncbi:MAG: hypothetical protein EZS28_044603 [Streblomastix strix]|uniref:Uncharacterized protein n=1 Tax=Streblomastix strix TaxID=222440 RepID=A0A5J4TPP6_9EUKA|nr:MAG: hypothetical protein EZS28_044603 [Streblomastix strix]